MERQLDRSPAPQPERRGFLKKISALLMGGVTALVPTAAGLAVFFDPLRRKSQAGASIRVTSLGSLPNDGTPRKFSIRADRSDAWNKYPHAPVGAVYLRRTGEKTVEALNVVCPHAGCFVDYRAADRSFFCPCHNSSFNVDGTIADLKSPSPRALDSLEVEIRHQTEVWVKFQNFRIGRAEKLPLA
ncbi:MAG: Rieske 2Fe-2S domain-containing protein [Verrucomicrobiota bacterium]